MDDTTNASSPMAGFPHPWALAFSASGPGDTGLLLMQESVRVFEGGNLPGPGGPGTNSPEKLTQLSADFDACLQVLPGFLPRALEVHRMGDYDAELVMRAADDSARPASLPADAQLQLGVVRGSPLLHFTAFKLPRVAFKFMNGSPRISFGTVEVGGAKISCCVQQNTVLFFPSGTARYQSASTSDSTLTFDDATASNYFVLGTLPDNWFDDGSALTQLAEAAFSYPTGSTVTYTYDSTGQTVDVTSTLKTANVLGLPVNTAIHGLLPGHYLPSPMQDNTPVLQGNPTPVRSKAGKPMRFLTARGELRVFAASSFTCRYAYPGILPWVPPLDARDQEGRAQLEKWVNAVFAP
ncbi:hypothetical protein [Pyxidicoccus caerfyrddinensis]|uniref:hypothetical protein n=1 Tax=Pyxidicoccus caerfyrddinensis TaxID=2709663 RepID=UPI0013DADEE3|nr:hypothetical protein [Pyxidicoccus caerfyrddinensis]